MPFYEYECPRCGFKDEILQMISEKPLTKCPSCGKQGLKKLVSAPVFRLKGSGWYETDFKSDKENKRNLAGADKEDAAKDSTADAKANKADAKADKADAKTETKSETKSETKAEKSESAKPTPVKTSAKPAKAKSKPASRSKRGARR